jgi:hypothetical protein
MHSIDIYRAGNIVTSIFPDGTSTQSKKVMGDNQLSISFEDNKYLDIRINDYCSVFGESYYLNRVPVVTKGGKYRYRFSIVMDGEGYNLAKAQYLFLNSTNLLTETDFSLMGNPDTFIDLILQNVSRIDTDWEKGQIIHGPYKNLTFTKENCYNALSRLAEEYETEFWIEGKKIHLTKRSNDTGYTFRHGRDKGLYEIIRQSVDNSNVATRIYPYGSDKNLPEDYIILSRRLRLPEGVFPFLEKNTANYGFIEHTEIFEDIYPHRTGKVTAVNAGDPFVFTDADIDFDVNIQLLPGITAKLVFNTGQLAGYKFELSSFNNGTKQFRMLKNGEEKVLDLPSTLFRPAIGDTYVLEDIRMPDEYIAAAELELQERAQTLLDQICEPQLSYVVQVDPVFLRKRNRTVNIGDLVWIVDPDIDLQKKIRVTGTIRNLLEEYQYQLEISDTVTPGTISRIINSVNSNDRNVNDINFQLANNSILNNNVVGTLTFQDMPETATTTGFLQVYIELSSGKLYKKV